MNIMAKWTPTVHPAAETPPPFPPVQFLSANLLTGADILLPVQDITESTTSTEQPALLRRTSVSASNILCIETVENGPLHFWLQRKIRTTPSHGSVRAGFVLKNKNDKEDVGHGRWEVATTVAEQGATAGESQVQMVAIHKQRKESFVKDSTELAALQWVAQHAASNEESMQHVQNSVLAAADLNFTYTVMPYDYAVSPSLFEYCISQPGAILSEERARDFFRQILKGLEILKCVQLCHCNLSLESVILRRTRRNDSSDEEYCCTITQLGSAMRIPFEQDGSVNHMLQPRPLSGIHNPQYVAPELWNCSSGNDKVVFDGFAVDLWAAGVMLLAMLLGNDALFVAPVPEDRAFHQISVHGHLKKFVTAYHQRLSRASIISDDALDLIQQMLRIDSNDRLTLAEVKQHPWVLCTSSAL